MDTKYLVAISLIVSVPAFTVAQSADLPRTPWGKPDLQGIWGAGYILTPLERPDEYEGREFLTDEEVAKAVDLELKAGEMSLHHGMLAHSSQPNRSSRRRCGLVMRYIPPTVKQAVLNSLGNRYRAVLVRGEDREHNFGEIPAPF